MTHMARNGIPTMMIVAKNLCRLIVKYESVIATQFPGNAPLLAALAAANAACGVLAAELALNRDYGD